MRSWGTHRVALRAYRGETGKYPEEIAIHGALQSAEARLDLLRHGVNQAEGLVSSCTMSFEAMPRLLRKKALAGPFMAMSRICLESAGRLSYLYDDQISPDQRLMRFAALWAWSNHESRKAASVMKRLPEETLSELVQYIDGEVAHLDEIVNSSGFQLDRSGRAPVVRDPSGTCLPEAAELNMVNVLEKMLPNIGNEYYRRSSGFIHSAPWALGQAVRWLASDILSPTLTPTQIAEAFLLAGAGVARTINLSSWYSGIPIGLVQRRIDTIIDLTQAELIHQDKLRSQPQDKGTAGKIGAH